MLPREKIDGTPVHRSIIKVIMVGMYLLPREKIDGSIIKVMGVGTPPTITYKMSRTIKFIILRTSCYTYFST